MMDRLTVHFKTEREVIVLALCFSKCDELDTPLSITNQRNPAPNL